jgi:uncharacterized protein (DUF1697 family)
MDTLRQVFEALGFSSVETFIASGNVVFETEATDTGALERKIEMELQQELGYEVATFVRTADEIAAIVTYRPFGDLENEGGAEVHVVFMVDRLDRQLQQEVIEVSTDSDIFRVPGREVYWLRRHKQGGLPFSTAALEKVLRRPFTVRGARTVQKIVAKYSSSS